MTHRLAQGPAELVTKVKGEGDEGGQSVGGGVPTSLGGLASMGIMILFCSKWILKAQE